VLHVLRTHHATNRPARTHLRTAAADAALLLVLLRLQRHLAQRMLAPAGSVRVVPAAVPAAAPAATSARGGRDGREGVDAAACAVAACVAARAGGAAAAA
jgi:hypothetical protein